MAADEPNDDIAAGGGQDVCPDCDGSGQVHDGVCATCGGTGWIEE